MLVPLPADLPFDHPDFVAAWAAAAKQTKAPAAPAAGTLGSTWRAVLASDRLAAVSASYRASIEREAARICGKADGAAANLKAVAINEQNIRADLTEAEDKRARLKAWRIWAEYCVERGWIASNPAQPIKIKARQVTGHVTWSRDEIALFRASYPIGSVPRLIFEVAYWTGARISDAVKIGPQHLDRDGVLVFSQDKTGSRAYVPWTCPLPDYAADMLADRDLCHAAIAAINPRCLTFLQTARGRARSKKGASNALTNAAGAIGLDRRTAHGLRKSRAVALAESGATSAQIGAWTGHRSLSEIEHYTREMDRRRIVMGTVQKQKLETSADPLDTTQRKSL